MRDDTGVNDCAQKLRSALCWWGGSRFAEGDPGFGQVVGRELHIDPITGNDTDEVFPHLA